MSKEIIKHIMNWAEGKEPWHRDAIRRIYQKGELSIDDLNELEMMCLTYRGISVPKKLKVPEPLSLKAADIGSAEFIQQPVNLLKVSGVNNVNNLADGENLTFGEKGLSIIYGDNGAGKSGYSRILKQVCRARSKDSKILPNVFKEPPTELPTAKIDYKIGEEKLDIIWKQDQDCPAELSNVSLFDSECASVHVTEENALAFTPQGLDILPKLAELFRTLRTRIHERISALERRQAAFVRDVEKFPETEVYKRVKSLKHNSDVGELKKWAERNETEKTRLKDLTTILSQDPTQQAKVFELRKGRLVQLRDICEQLQELTSLGSVEEIYGYWKNYRSARQAADLAAKKLFTEEELSGVGNETWKVLWEAARRFSVQDAYPGKVFPVVEDEALCLLCLQPVSDAAAKRLTGFEEFVKGETEKASLDAEKAMREALSPLIKIDIKVQDITENCKELALENQDLANKVRRTLILNRWRRRRILRNIASAEWKDVPAAPEYTSTELRKVIDAVEQKYKDAIKAANSEERALLEKELSELQAREWISELLREIEKEINRLSEIEKLKLCLRDVDTTGLTRKNTELTDEFVTDALKAAFDKELKLLGLTYLGVELAKMGGQYGASRYQVQLNGKKQEIPVAKIVSEGEHRAIALAAFLAELATEPTRSGLIFDDPVSSLDHRWRLRIADRLVAEAERRQIIILTHDLVFLHVLLEAAKRYNLKPTVSHMIRETRGAGISLDGVPWVAMSVKKRIGYLKAQLQQAGAVFRKIGVDAYEPMGRHIYGLLRETWERSIEEVLLGQVIMRFGREIQTNRLRYVSDINEDDINIITDNMAKCSCFMQGHDQAAAVNEKVPPPDELGKDIETLEAWVESMRPRRR